VKRLILGLLLSGCATSYRPAVTGPTAFSFQLTPEQCAQMQKERRTYRATGKTSLLVAGSGAVLTGVALAFTDAKVAPAVSTGLTLAASGVGTFVDSQASDLDEELADGGCGR
jgi:hypothetical protein